MLLFRRDSLGSTEGVPQHKGKILALSELQKRAGGLLQCHCGDNNLPCSDNRSPNPPAPQVKSSEKIWARQEPAKPVNPGETNLSRLFNCHWPESRPCPQARVKGQNLLCSLTGNTAEITGQQPVLRRAVWNVHLTAHIVAIFIERLLLGTKQEKESLACCTDLERNGSQSQNSWPEPTTASSDWHEGQRHKKGCKNSYSLILTSSHFKDSQACSVNKKRQTTLEKAAFQL